MDLRKDIVTKNEDSMRVSDAMREFNMLKCIIVTILKKIAAIKSNHKRCEDSNQSIVAIKRSNGHR